MRFDVERSDGSGFDCGIDPRLRRTDAQHTQRSTHQSQHDRIDTNRSGAEHQHRVADLYVTTLDGMKRSRQSATTRHKRLRFCVEPDATGAGLDVDVSGPSAAESIVKTIGDAVNLPVRASCSGFSDEAVPTRIARAMNIEKRDALAFVESLAFDVEQLAADLLQTSDRDVPGNKRIRHTCEPTLLQVNIRAANFRELDFKERGVWLEIRFDNFTNFEGFVWFGDDGDEWHGERIYCITTSR